MKIIKENIFVFSEKCIAELMVFEEKDKKKWRKLWSSWINLKMGLREYKSREPNIPEGLTETAFCIATGSTRAIKISSSHSSFDTYNLKNGKAEQIKACSVKGDLTSFGPKSEWDDLYFLDFYREGKMDGSFDIYLIPSKLIYSQIMNKGKKETFRDQQKQGRRPRFSLKTLIKDKNIKPFKKNVII